MADAHLHRCRRQGAGEVADQTLVVASQPAAGEGVGGLEVELAATAGEAAGRTDPGLEGGLTEARLQLGPHPLPEVAVTAVVRFLDGDGGHGDGKGPWRSWGESEYRGSAPTGRSVARLQIRPIPEP